MGCPLALRNISAGLRVGPDREPRAQYELGLLPERQDPFTPTLAHDVHGGQGAIREIAQLQRYEFRHPQPASIGQMQHGAIAGAKARSGIRGIEQSLDLSPVEVVDQRLVGLLGRDRSDAERQIQAGRNPILDVAEEGPDRGEPAVAGPHAAAAPVSTWSRKAMIMSVPRSSISRSVGRRFSRSAANWTRRTKQLA
jgi:hypothetical protein